MSEVLRLENVTRRYQAKAKASWKCSATSTCRCKPARSWRWWAQSGAGKSSLLHMAGLLEAPTGGEIYIDGAAVSRLPGQRAHPHPPRHDRLCLSGASSAAGIRRAGECGAAADDRGQNRAPRRRRKATRLLTVLGLGAAADPPPGAIVGRRAAARRHRPRPGQQAADSSGRRAHRQSRSPHRRAACSTPDRRSPAPQGLAA